MVDLFLFTELSFFVLEFFLSLKLFLSFDCFLSSFADEDPGAFDFSTEENRDIFVRDCYQNNILVNPTSTHSVRLRPNLALTQEELDDFLARIKKMDIRA